jgi:serine/threonine protein kinase
VFYINKCPSVILKPHNNNKLIIINNFGYLCPIGLDDKNKVYREVENLKKVNSAYIAKYYDWWIGEKTFYIIMEYCPDNLRKIINLRPAAFTRHYGQTMGDLEYYMTCEIFRQTLEYVQYMHGLSPPVIHRDLKPENILISYDSEHDRFVKLCDFGLAAVHNKTINNQGSNAHTMDVGTIAYQAPEIAKGVKYDHKSDVYSLAVIGAELFELDREELEK